MNFISVRFRKEEEKLIKFSLNIFNLIFSYIFLNIKSIDVIMITQRSILDEIDSKILLFSVVISDHKYVLNKKRVIQ